MGYTIESSADYARVQCTTLVIGHDKRTAEEKLEIDAALTPSLVCLSDIYIYLKVEAMQIQQSIQSRCTYPEILQAVHHVATVAATTLRSHNQQ